MAEFIVTNSGAPGETGGLTFEEAVQQSILNPGADTIRFGFTDDVTEITLHDVVTISGELTIDGDVDHDGISDVVFNAAANARHLNIDATGVVTIINVDFFGGNDAPKADDGTYVGSERLPASSWDRRLCRDADDADSRDTAADRRQLSSRRRRRNGDGGDGTDGADGVDGLDAAGSILNQGSLTLERVGFGDNYARGEIGQKGGTGGSGGTSVA